MLIDILTNKIVLSAIFSAVAAQIIKSLIHLYKTGQYDWRWLFRDAGMPSAHTATVVAATLSVYMLEGMTNLTIICGVYAAITIRNVIGDKIFAEKQEKLINQIIIKIQQSLAGERVEWKHLIGHSIREVIVGFILGLFITGLVFYYL